MQDFATEKLEGRELFDAQPLNLEAFPCTEK